MQRKIAITGHTKGIGKCLYKRLTDKGYEVRGYSTSTGYNILRPNRIINDVVGWADVFVSDIKISGSKEKGAKHQIETTLTNYNETYNSTNYNGYTATGYYELFIDSELVHTSSFSIEPESSESFQFEWTSTGNYHEFNVKAYVNDGEINKENNEYTKEQIFESERKSGFLPSISLLSCVITMCIIVSFKRSKPN